MRGRFASARRRPTPALRLEPVVTLALVALALVAPWPRLAVAGTKPAFDARFDFLYIAANEGDGSAGHVAVAFGDRTYDFGRRDDGLLTLDRSASRDFRYRYAVRGNRAIRRLHVAVTAATRELLLGAFEHRYDVQQRDLAALKGARDASDNGSARAIEDAYRYELLGRNCVSELFGTVDDALASAPDGAMAASTRLLGGHIAPGGLTSLPRVAAAAVRRTWRVVAADEIPSYRRYRVGVLERGRPWVALRESNVLTSSIYRRSEHDSIFLFFTDGAVAARPLLGAVNGVAGLLVTAAGLAVAPVDRGALLVGGVRGVVYSLPELAFVNIRKGTFPDATPDDADALVGAEDCEGTVSPPG